MEIERGLEQKLAPILARRDYTLLGALGIEYIKLSKDCVIASMPVDNRTKQPFGLLHGGASVSLAESLASIAAWLNVDEKKYAVVGIEINANHIQSLKSGTVLGTAKPIHRGRSTQVWEVEITSEEDRRLISISRCTLAVIELRLPSRRHDPQQS